MELEICLCVFFPLEGTVHCDARTLVTDTADFVVWQQRPVRGRLPGHPVVTQTIFCRLLIVNSRGYLYRNENYASGVVRPPGARGTVVRVSFVRQNPLCL